MILSTIDPGTHSGWARFAERSLTACGLGPDSYFGHVIIEVPVIYPGSRKVNPNDLITLAVKVGEHKYAAESRGCSVELVKPRTWKGTIDGDIMCARILRLMTPAERAIFNAAPGAASYRHNILDAIGIGLWKLGRLSGRQDV